MSDNNSFDAGKAVDQIKKDRNLTIIAGGAVAVIVGLFLPWYTVSFLSVSSSVSPGLNSTGMLLLIFSVVSLAAGLNVLNKDKKQMSIASIVAGVLALLVMLNNWPDSDLSGAVSTGIGYWLGLAGSVAIVAGSAMAYKSAQTK
jgi:hypothetical protein